MCKLLTSLLIGMLSTYSLPLFARADLSVMRNVFEPALTAPAKQPSLLKTKIITVYYANLEDVYHFLSNKQYKLLSSTGSLNINKPLKQIWIKDDEQHVKEIVNIIHQIDVPHKQVLIKARIVNVDMHSLDVLGVSFMEKSLKAVQGDGDFSASIRSESVTFPIVTLKQDSLLDMQLSALEKKGHAQILAKPELTTLDHQTAIIQSGEEVPYEEKTPNGGTSVVFKKAALELQVTPEILPNNQIRLALNINQDKISPVNVAGTPAIHTQKIRTQVLVKDRQTIVLGGIFEEMNNHLQRHVPFFYKIPLLGLLFRHRLRTVAHKELIVFVTPTILH
jgi:type IV pilus assembly protein PilQ